MAILDAVEPNHDAACLYRFRSGSSQVSSGCNEYVVGTVRPRGRRTGRVTPTVSDPRRNAVAFTAIDGNLRPFRARLISAIHASSVVPRSRLGEVMAGGVRIYAPRLPLPDQIG
jgi:hypothetical protein